MLLFVYQTLVRNKKGAKLPPQPPGLPILGNIHQFAAAAKNHVIHLKLEEWAREYGDIFRVKLGPVTTYYLNSDVAVKVSQLGR